jgi:hypothetical protein
MGGKKTLIEFKISAGPTKERGKRKHPNGERERDEIGRTVCHGYHRTDIPGGEITVEGSSTSKHCTTGTKRSNDQQGGKKTLIKFKISARPTKERGKRKHPNKDPILERDR